MTATLLASFFRNMQGQRVSIDYCEKLIAGVRQDSHEEKLSGTNGLDLYQFGKLVTSSSNSVSNPEVS